MELVSENPTSLAWMGDALYSCRVREHLLKRGIQSPKKLQALSAKFCSAKGQAAILEHLENCMDFSQEEQEILRRGRNANVHSTAKNADRATYMKSTAYEALIGYLYLYGHQQRLETILSESIRIGDLL